MKRANRELNLEINANFSLNNCMKIKMYQTFIYLWLSKKVFMFPFNNLKGRNSSLENQSGFKRRHRQLTQTMEQGSADKPACSVGSLKLQQDADKVHVSPCSL